MVKVRVPTQLRNLCGGEKELEVEGARISEVLEAIKHAHPELGRMITNDAGELHRFVNVYVDDDDVRYTGLGQTPTHDGAVVSIIPAVAGG